MRYAVHFVPHKLEREKLALLRRQLCKRFGNRKAVMYPIHMTLVKELSFDDYGAFMERLEAFCGDHKPLRIKAEKNLGNGNSWGGVVVEEAPALLRFQLRLLEALEEVAVLEPFEFKPHFSLVYAKNLPNLGRRTSPVKKMLLDRVSLVMQTRKGTPYRVAKHIPLGL